MTPPATDDEVRELVRLRRDFHRHPELGYQETRTAAIVAKRLQELDYSVREGVAVTGVLGDRGRGGRTLLVRADMDALPIEEQSDADYRSVHAGVMHACGHDAHTAIGLVAAARFAAIETPGSLRFAFQPAEEGGQGADRMIEQGALDGVDAVLGLHVWNSMPVGVVGVTPGAAMAAVDDFSIEVRGEGGHAAMPHQTDDPIVRAAAIVSNLQTVVSRRVSPFDAAVVSVTQIHGGTAFNVIPDVVHVQGTVRTFLPHVREEVHRRIRECVGERGTVQMRSVTRPLVNDGKMCELVHDAAVSVVGEENVLTDERTMGGEDFAAFLERVPGCFFFVGSQSPSGSMPHHHPSFDIDERSLPLGLEIMTRAVRSFFEREA
jgi:amidohydrolase